MWQYSSEGVVDGISGRVDLNYAIKDYPTIIKRAGLNKTNINSVIYTVQAGDNLTKIAKKYNTNWKNIYNINKNVIGNDPNIIKPGQQLVIKEENRWKIK